MRGNVVHPSITRSFYTSLRILFFLYLQSKAFVGGEHITEENSTLSEIVLIRRVETSYVSTRCLELALGVLTDVVGRSRK